MNIQQIRFIEVPRAQNIFQKIKVHFVPMFRIVCPQCSDINQYGSFI
jgi:hypothetical protein